MDELVWTKTPPTVPGWYWHRWFNKFSKQFSKGRMVECSGNGILVDDDGVGWTATQDFDEWAGPIPEPKEGDSHAI